MSLAGHNYLNIHIRVGLDKRAKRVHVELWYLNILLGKLK